jgi:hypothetical protein
VTRIIRDSDYPRLGQCVTRIVSGGMARDPDPPLLSLSPSLSLCGGTARDPGPGCARPGPPPPPARAPLPGAAAGVRAAGLAADMSRS